MIIITRKRDQGVVIRHDIIVNVLEIRGDQVRLGIEHPAEVPVHRGEVFAAIRRETEAAEEPRPPF